MREALVQTFQNLRANKLRSFLTMFGILWGVISVVILSATGEGFRHGNEHVLEELGKNIAIVWGGRTSTAGGRRARRPAHLPDGRRRAHPARAVAADARGHAGDPARRPAREERVQRRVRRSVHGIEPQYQEIRTLDIERGRQFNWDDERQVHRVAIVGADIAKQLFAGRDGIGQTVIINGIALHRRRQDPEEGSGQQLQRARQRQGVRAVRGDGAGLSDARRASRARCRTSSSRRSSGWSTTCRGSSTERTGRIDDIDWALETRRPPRARAPQRLRPRRPRSHVDVGHVGELADVRPHGRHDAGLLHAPSASSRWPSAASA